jgi:hypothetical protein
MSCQDGLTKNKKSKKSEKDRLKKHFSKQQYTFYTVIYTTFKAHKKYTRTIN